MGALLWCALWCAAIAATATAAAAQDASVGAGAAPPASASAAALNARGAPSPPRAPGRTAYVTQSGGACPSPPPPPPARAPPRGAKCETFPEALRDPSVGRIVLLENIKLQAADWPRQK